MMKRRLAALDMTEPIRGIKVGVFQAAKEKLVHVEARQLASKGSPAVNIPFALSKSDIRHFIRMLETMLQEL